MEASDLRIGNLILPEHDLDGKYHVVKELGEKSINGYLEDWYSPIGLSPEILKACGFEKRLDGIRDPLYTFYKNPLFVKIRKNDFNDIRIHGDLYKNLYHIKYLHQLQNLYFALTGEDLKLKNLPHKLLNRLKP